MKKHEFKPYQRAPFYCGEMIDNYARCSMPASHDIHMVAEADKVDEAVETHPQIESAEYGECPVCFGNAINCVTCDGTGRYRRWGAPRCANNDGYPVYEGMFCYLCSKVNENNPSATPSSRSKATGELDAEHSPLPWRVTVEGAGCSECAKDGPGYGIRDANNNVVTVSEHDSQAPSEIDMELIIKSVNAHDALVEALKEVEAAFFKNAESGSVNIGRGQVVPIDSEQHPWISGAAAWPVVRKVRAALALATGKGEGGNQNGR